MSETINTEDREMDLLDDEKEIEGESKADKFKRLASKRTNNAIKAISSIGKLSTSAYEYTPEQVEKIFAAIGQACDEAKSKFEKKKPESAQFSL